MRHLLQILCAVGLILPAWNRPAVAQDERVSESTAEQRAETEDRLRALENQIKEYEALLARRSSEERSEVSSLRDLERRIRVQEQLIATYRTRNRHLVEERSATETSVMALQAELDRHLGQYRRLVRHAYKHGRMSYLSVLFTSQSVNQMLIRVKYLRTFLAQRRQRLVDVEETAERLGERRTALSETIGKNEALLTKDRQEREKLADMRRERQRVVDRLRREQTTLRKELETSRKNAEQLQARLRTLITEDADRSSALGPIEAATLSAISSAFATSKGNLPWPVQGVITDEFGTRVHPVYKTRTPNPGIEIAASPAAPVRAVHSGVVNRILVMPGYGTCITVSHGDYTTVYCNLSEVGVREGQRVIRGQSIGKSGTADEPRQNSLFFALFTSTGTSIDPSPWLRPN